MKDGQPAKAQRAESIPTKSIVYRNIHVYRLILNLVYAGKYRSRFDDVATALVGHKHVLELCFGDTYVANHCRDNGIKWTGYDLNESFVQSACEDGFDAYRTDILGESPFPQNDLTVIQGSLYHFHDLIDVLFDKVFHSTHELLVSEPVRNLSSGPGVIGWLARRSANAGKGHEQFRYNEQTLLEMIEQQATRLQCNWSILSKKRDMTILMKRSSSLQS